MSRARVPVTGATGCIRSHVVLQLGEPARLRREPDRTLRQGESDGTRAARWPGAHGAA